MADPSPSPDPLSVTFDTLAVSRNASALRVLASALEEPEPTIRRLAVEALLRREHKAGLRAVVRAYHVLGETQAAVRERFEVLVPALRESIRDPWARARENVVDLVREHGGPRFAYLLTQALGDGEEAVRRKAADVLLAWAKDVGERWAASRDAPGTRAELLGPRNALLGPLWEAFRTFANHRSAAVLEALIHLDGRQLALALGQLRAGDDPRPAAALTAVRESDDPGVLAFLYDLLEHPLTAAGALETIARRTDAALVAALLEHPHALDREGVRARLAGVRSLAWLDPANPALTGLGPEPLKALARFILAAGLEDRERAGVLCGLLGRVGPPGRLALVQAVAGAPEAVARPVVQAALLDETEAVQAAATQLVLHGCWPERDRLLVGQLASPFESIRHQVIRELSRYSFRRYLEAFDQLDPATRELAGRVVQRIDERMVDKLADELHALDPKRRFRALQVIQALHLENRMTRHLLALLLDPDRVVRATVVKVLGVVRTLEAIQGIIGALSDRDARVQANAIEVLEDAGSEQLTGLLMPFLRHPNNRVRANAAKALIRLRYAPAAEVILAMLDEPSERMRLSAVWTAAHVSVPGALERLERMAQEDASPRVRTRAREAAERLRHGELLAREW